MSKRIRLLILSIAALLLLIGGQNVWADPLVKQQEIGCTQFAKVGMWEVYHCVDQDGHEFEANSAGMMIAVGN